jgi:hypothetical protein
MTDGSRLALEQGTLLSGRRDSEMIVCQLRCDPASRRAVQKTNLDQEWLIDFFDRILLLG